MGLFKEMGKVNTDCYVTDKKKKKLSNGKTVGFATLKRKKPKKK
ncbi:hypothetical protein [Alteribacillus bidgolensis]|uniref:Uncharacterized protein n=1 Tax=Alteribacillus bidgolensis TaxID=930129 RepID=A0A1G8FWR0_9BACI|nr:hypothetical protein [Alteribacillus bidgolensis]SDH86551.1 hypothetical protein SAMN05216352_103121 [Alteribacillus bidgolensis]